MRKPDELLDMDILSRGFEIEDDTPSAQPTVCSSENQMQFVQPDFMPMPQAEVTMKETHESEAGYNYFEDYNMCAIHVIIGKQTQTQGQKNCNRLTYDTNSKIKYICIARFIIDDITKLTIDELEQDTIQYEIKCTYYDEIKVHKQSIIFTLTEETIINSNKLTSKIKKEFGSLHIPFTPRMNKEYKECLSEYILYRFNKSPKEKYITAYPIANDISKLKDPEKKLVVKTFFSKVYDNHEFTNEMYLLLVAGFSALCSEKLIHYSADSEIPHMSKTIVIYGCKNIGKQRYIASLADTVYENPVIMKLSEISVTANKNELKSIFFHNQYRTVCFVDDEISDYAKNQNLVKIQRITEYISCGISRNTKPPIFCTAIVFTNRKLMEFKSYASDCIFVDANEIHELYYNVDDTSCLVTDFLSLLYENADYYFEDKEGKLRSKLNHMFRQEKYIQKAIDICKIYDFLAKATFDNFGVYSSAKSEDEEFLRRYLRLPRRSESILKFLNENTNILSSREIVNKFIGNLNNLIYRGKITIKLYDKSQTAAVQALLYDHNDCEILLFSNNYFEELFTSPIVDNKSFREILNEYGCMIVNTTEKCNFRLPIDDRKSYIAIKTSILNDKNREHLPELHPVFIPDLKEDCERLYLGNDEHDTPRYWSVGKLENRSVLVQGNTRMGKTYFATKRLITGLHDLDYQIVIFDSAASSYSEYELGKCGFDATYISKNFCYGKAHDVHDIINEITSNKDKIYIINSEVDDSAKQILCKLLFQYQQQQFNKQFENTRSLFIVLEEAGDSTLIDTPELKRIYNQGSKFRLSVITILQMFIGNGSQSFRRTVNQSALKISFRCSTDNIRYFTETIPSEMRGKAKNKLPQLDVGEAIICGEFENTDGLLSVQSFTIKRD